MIIYIILLNYCKMNNNETQLKKINNEYKQNYEFKNQINKR